MADPAPLLPKSQEELPKTITVRRWESVSEKVLNDEIDDREIEPDVTPATMVHLLYDDDLEKQQTKFKLTYPRFKKESLPKATREQEVKMYEDHSDEIYKHKQQALIAQFIKDSNANIKQWKSTVNNTSFSRRDLKLSQNRSRRKPEVECPEKYFTVIVKPPRVHVKVKQGAVDEDEVPGQHHPTLHI